MIPSLIPRETAGAARCSDSYRTRADLLVAEQSKYGPMYGESRRERLDQQRAERAYPRAMPMFGGGRPHSPNRIRFFPQLTMAC